MLDLDADIIPGAGVAGIAIGQSVEELLALGMEDDVESHIGRRVLKFGPVWAIDDGTGIIGWIWVKRGYRGKIAGKIGIGSRIAEVVAAFGPLEYIGMGEYQLDKGTPWLENDWTFIVERGSPVEGEPGWQDASIYCINVAA